jgi:KUP system potassium uptake protein
MGQIYVPAINGMLFAAVVFLVLFFKSSDNLAAAYGIAVASTMCLTTVFMLLVTRYIWKWSLLKSLSVTGALLAVDLLFVVTNAGKVFEGGWFPLAAGAIVFTAMTTWKRGREILLKTMKSQSLPLAEFLPMLCSSENGPGRVEGTAVFLNSAQGMTPASFMHNLKHNKVIHETNIFLTFTTEKVPYIANEDKLQVVDLGHNCYSVSAHIGFKDTAHVPNLLKLIGGKLGTWEYSQDATSFFLNRETVVATREIRNMAFWREKLFVIMQRNATRAADYFYLPPNRVVELGSQVTI